MERTQKLTEALPALRVDAEAGDVEAQYRLAVLPKSPQRDGSVRGSSRRLLGMEHLERLGVPLRGGARVQAPGLGRVSANASAADVEHEREIVVSDGIPLGGG